MSPTRQPDRHQRNAAITFARRDFGIGSKPVDIGRKAPEQPAQRDHVHRVVAAVGDFMRGVASRERRKAG